jgi:hypothetical protein
MDTWPCPMLPGAEDKWLRPIIFQIWVLNHIVFFLLIFKSDFNGFSPLFEDLEPDLRPDLGRKLRG